MTRKTAVWKFPLSMGAEPGWEVIEMPRYSHIVRVGQQNDVPTVWALVNPDEQQMEGVEVIAVPTGFALDGHHLYLGSTDLYSGVIVAHVFQRLPAIPDAPIPGGSLECGAA